MPFCFNVLFTYFSFLVSVNFIDQFRLHVSILHWQNHGFCMGCRWRWRSHFGGVIGTSSKTRLRGDEVGLSLIHAKFSTPEIKGLAGLHASPQWRTFCLERHHGFLLCGFCFGQVCYLLVLDELKLPQLVLLLLLHFWYFYCFELMNSGNLIQVHLLIVPLFLHHAFSDWVFPCCVLLFAGYMLLFTCNNGVHVLPLDNLHVVNNLVFRLLNYSRAQVDIHSVYLTQLVVHRGLLCANLSPNVLHLSFDLDFVDPPLGNSTCRLTQPGSNRDLLFQTVLFIL